MLAFLLAGSLLQTPAPIERDSYGVPHIYASTWEDALYYAGYSVAEDRLWQMENSRRVARGAMAEVFGKSAEAADRDALRFGYTDAELQAQFDSLSARVKKAFESYARGVNAYIADARANRLLPDEYARNGFAPAPWTVLDSSAIAVRLFQLFGRRDPGELQNLALYLYLQTQPAKDRVLDVLDDFLWQNDPASPTTVGPQDDPHAASPPKPPKLSRDITERHLASLPRVGLMEILPALRISQAESRTRLAMGVGAPFRAGSYAIVVGKGRSATGTPILLSAPQMGFFSPAIIHEMSIVGPGISVSGMDVPGVPLVAIGHTQHMAWGLTTGAADSDDIYFFKADGPDGYLFGSERRKVSIERRTLRVKGEADQVVERRSTHLGPVVLESRSTGTLFARRSGSHMSELRSIEALFSLLDARSANDLERPFSLASVNFNFFYAFVGGDIGWRYLGSIPDRAEGFDPRFPLPGVPEAMWKGFVPYSKMPRVANPKNGLVVNWNNKPAAWWPNGDAPVWGRVSRVEALQRFTDKGRIGIADVESAAWSIARIDPAPALGAGSWPHFAPHVRRALAGAAMSAIETDAAAYLASYDGRALDGSQGASIYQMLIAALREELFLPTTGNFLSPSVFALAASPSVMLNALEGRTSIAYLKGRSAEDAIRAAFRKAVQRLEQSRGGDPGMWGFAAGGIAVPNQPPIPYSNRGSYIQIVELRATPRGRNVLTPGVAERGAHSFDQVHLARGWQYKPMHMRPFERG